MTLTEPLRFSMVTLPRGGTLVRSTEPLLLVTQTCAADAIEGDVAAVGGEGERAGRRWWRGRLTLISYLPSSRAPGSRCGWCGT